VSEPQARADHFAPYKTSVTTAERVAFILLLALAAFLRLYRLPEVPPGIHDDEIINVQIADQLLAGAPFSVFYEAGEGREGLYHPLLVASRMLTARVPYWYRLPSVVCSLLTILLVHRLSRRCFGLWTALVAAGGLAVAFWPVHLGREALRVVTLPPLAAGMSLALWHGLEQRVRGKRALWWFALAGLLLGLAQYTYLAARVLPLLVLLFTAYLACFHRTRLRLHWPGLVLLLVVSALVAAPLAVYIGTHWGQQERITRLSEPLQALLDGDPRPALSSSAATLGMFVWRGDPQPHYNLPGRPVFKPIGGVFFLAGLLIALRNLRHPASAFCLLWTATTLGPGMLTRPAPHSVRTAGALVTAFVFPGLTVRWLVRRIGLNWQTALAAALGLLLVFNAGLTFRDYFHRWPDLDDVRAFHHAGLAEVARYLDRTPETAPIAACTPFLNEQHFFWRTDRPALPYLLNRRDLDIGWYSCLEAQLFPRGGRTSLYLFGDDRDFAPFVPPEWVAQAQTITTLRGERLIHLEVADHLETWLAQFTRPTEPSPSFGDTMRFLGYRQEPVAPLPGGTLEILTAWQVLAAPPNDLAIFLHLLDSDGKLVEQGDALAALSDTLRPEDVFVQQHTIALAEDLRPGEYRLVTGLYVREGTRLSLDSGAGDALTLDIVGIRDGRD
jgi:4-amino-4-deoxy-L-arabinose transferase-like glycosyltransferase